MPSFARHVRGAANFEALAYSLLPDSPSWAVVVAFYSALHWIDAYLASAQSIHPKSHTERELCVRRTELRQVYDSYRLLNDRSRDARYDLRVFSADEARSLISIELSRIRAYVQTLT